MWLLARNPGRWAPSGLARALREAASGQTLPPRPKAATPRRRRGCWRLLGSALLLPPLGPGRAVPLPLGPRLRAPPLGLWGDLSAAARGYGAGKPAAGRQEAVAEGPDRGSQCGRRPDTQQQSADQLSAGSAAAGGSPELYENPWTIPNLLCVARISLSPYLGYLIVHEKFNLALGLFALAGVTDLLDGFIARNWANQKSALGSALDPLADKILISFLYISLTCADLIPGPLTAMILFRDAVLIAAVFYVRYQTVPPPRTLSKYFNPCYATAQLKPTFISKVNTAVQLVLVAASLAAPVFHYVDSAFLQTLWYITGLTTAASAYSYYLYGRNTVQVLKRGK
ncbi:cardiolipin synthase (CMP-forming) [Callorhinchus milii]|nr:cardiolipin synthase (CMP-forming) [Callorhinchus milii]